MTEHAAGLTGPLLALAGQICQFVRENSTRFLVAFTVALILFLLTRLRGLAVRYWKYLRRSKYQYLFGRYHAYFLADDGKTVVHAHCELLLHRFRGTKVRMTELHTRAKYTYTGWIVIDKDVFYSYLRGDRHDDRALLVCKIPFNYGPRLHAMSGILAGVGPDNKPAATKILLARSSLTPDIINNELGSLRTRRIAVRDVPRIVQGVTLDADTESP